MQRRRMRRTVIVNIGFVVEANRVDNQRTIFVMADRFSVPGGFWILRVRHVHTDMTHLLIVFRNDQHLVWRLKKIDRPIAFVDVDVGDAARPAALARRERNFSGQDLVIGLLHLFFGPGLENRIAQIGNPERELALGLSEGIVRMLLVGDDRTRARFWWQEIVARGTVRYPERAGVGGKNEDRARVRRARNGWRTRQNPRANEASHKNA